MKILILIIAYLLTFIVSYLPTAMLCRILGYSIGLIPFIIFHLMTWIATLVIRRDLERNDGNQKRQDNG